jgi:hypothetical protein
MLKPIKVKVDHSRKQVYVVNNEVATCAEKPTIWDQVDRWVRIYDRFHDSPVISFTTDPYCNYLESNLSKYFRRQPFAQSTRANTTRQS